MTSRNDDTAAAQETWRALLRSIDDQETFVTRALAEQRARGLVAHGEPVVTTAEPRFVTAALMAADREVVAAVRTCLIAAGDQILAEPQLHATYLGDWLTDKANADLFTAPSGYSEPIVLGRFDGGRDADGTLHILEFNGGLPGGVMPADVGSAYLADWDIAREFSQAHPFVLQSLGVQVVRALVETWHDFGGAGLPFTAVALPDEVKAVAAGPLAYLATIAEAEGIEFVVADPGAFTHEDQRLRLGGRPVDLLIRGFFTSMFAYLGDRIAAIGNAVRAGDVCMVASLRSGLYGHKALFAAVTDESVALDVPDDVRRRALAHLPWTRLLADTTTADADGHRIELAAAVLADRANLVIKPVEGFGGAGVHLGWQHSDESWVKVRDEALAAGGHIVQRRVELSREEIPTLATGFGLREYTVDHNPVVAGSAIAGYFVRLVEGHGATNMTGGGSLSPVFLLE